FRNRGVEKPMTFFQSPLQRFTHDRYKLDKVYILFFLLSTKFFPILHTARAVPAPPSAPPPPREKANKAEAALRAYATPRRNRFKAV
ncbi:MAG: hypothetical protein LBP19_04205, partial [Treponema sp.]|nr:hypothetical protein [Treponema sp.]